MFRVSSFEEVVNVLKKFPNCVVLEKQNSSVSTETHTTVSFSNWLKYQGDYSYGRVLKFRANETAKKRREEKRRDKKRKEEKNIDMEKFKKPSVEEVTTYASSIGFNLDGEKFCAFYESNGWRIGRNPMKSWKSAVVTWKKNDFNGGSHAKQTNIGSPQPELEKYR